MIYYFLPGHGIYGGIKVAYQFVDALNALGHSAVIASPGGLAATWFSSSAPVADRDEVFDSWQADDIGVFSLPGDYEILRPRIPRLAYHCQGTDPAIDSFVSDSHLRILTGWSQANDYVRERGVEPFDVGFSISQAFYYSGERRFSRSIAVMPRRGREMIDEFLFFHPRLRARVIDQMTEAETAEVMKSSQFFLASAEGEWLGLPALEAMAAGCVVLSVPVRGGMQFLKSGENCLVGQPRDLARSLSEASRDYRGLESLATRAMQTAQQLAPSRFRAKVSEALDAGVLTW